VYLKALQTDLVYDLFVRTADENYITARWCGVNGLNTDFFWLAVHALEKYLKAVLLLNGRPSKGYGHNIVKLYSEVKTIAGQLLPNRLQQPQALDIDHWYEQSAEDFVAHLYGQGNPDNRYLIYGYLMRPQDLHMFDQMVFAVRRLVCPLDDRVFASRASDGPTLTHRELLSNRTEYYGRLFMPLDELIQAKENSPARIAALNLNAAFAPLDFQHTPIYSGNA
jgi:HEPN domain-containing protein